MRRINVTITSPSVVVATRYTYEYQFSHFLPISVIMLRNTNYHNEGWKICCVRNGDEEE